MSMDHEELHKEIKKDLEKVKDDIIAKLDDYQKRVSTLEANQAWIKKAVIGAITAAVGTTGYVIKEIISQAIKG